LASASTVGCGAVCGDGDLIFTSVLRASSTSSSVRNSRHRSYATSNPSRDDVCARALSTVSSPDMPCFCRLQNIYSSSRPRPRHAGHRPRSVLAERVVCVDACGSDSVAASPLDLDCPLGFDVGCSSQNWGFRATRPCGLRVSCILSSIVSRASSPLSVRRTLDIDLINALFRRRRSALCPLSSRCPSSSVDLALFLPIHFTFPLDPALAVRPYVGVVR